MTHGAMAQEKCLYRNSNLYSRLTLPYLIRNCYKKNKRTTDNLGTGKVIWSATDSKEGCRLMLSGSPPVPVRCYAILFSFLPVSVSTPAGSRHTFPPRPFPWPRGHPQDRRRFQGGRSCPGTGSGRSICCPLRDRHPGCRSGF